MPTIEGVLRVTPTAPGVAALLVDDHPVARVRAAIPRPAVQLVVRIGPMAEGGLDVHAIGARAHVVRKRIARGQRIVSARLGLDAVEAVLGVSAAALAGRIVDVAALWGDGAARELRERIAAAPDLVAAARVLDRTIADRSGALRTDPRARLAVAAADRLARERVNVVADDLGVSERHLRRVFQEVVGVSPKAFARLTRFRRAIAAAREPGGTSWASIASAAGYYDQAHLIAEFRAIAGVTPRALLAELGR